MIVLRNFSNKGALVPADRFKVDARTMEILKGLERPTRKQSKLKQAVRWLNGQFRNLKGSAQTRKIPTILGMGAGAAKAGYLAGKKKAEERAIKAGGKVAKGVLAGTALLGGAAAYAASKRKGKKDDSED